MNNYKSIFLIIIHFYIFTNLYADKDTDSIKNAYGLNLKLDISHKLNELVDNKFNDIFTIRITIQNSSNKDVCLKAKWPDDRFTGDLLEYIRVSTLFKTNPDVFMRVFQTENSKRTLSQPKLILKAGEKLKVNWEAHGNSLRDESKEVFPGTTPVFPLLGKYEIQSILDLNVDEDIPILLYSNKVYIKVGGSGEIPKHTKAMVIYVNDKITRINKGSIEGIEKGDLFQICVGYCTKKWKIEITIINDHYSEGKYVNQSNIKDMLPTVGMDAKLIIDQ